MEIYIYILINTVNKKAYIGVTKHPDKRIKEHKNSKSFLGNALRKYKFDFHILGIVDDYEKAYKLESLFIEEMDSFYPNGYNMDSGGLGGRKFSETTKQKLRIAQTGKKLSETTKQKIRNSKRGQRGFCSKETRVKIRNKLKGKKRKPFTKEHKQNIGNSLRGKKISKESIAKREKTKRKKRG